VRSPHVSLRRLVRPALGLLVLLSLVAAVSPVARAASGKDAKVTIRFLTWDLPVLTDNFVNPCSKQYPNITVKVERDYSSGYNTKLQTEFAAGTAPDIFLNSETTTMEWAHKGLLLDQVPYRKELGLPYGTDKYMVSPVQYGEGNKIYGYPNVVSTMVIYFNKNTFDQAKVAYPPSDAAHAWTWDHFVQVAKQLTIDRQGRHPDDPGFDAKHIQRYGASVSAWWATILPLLYSNGATVFDPTYKHYTMDSPAAAQVIQAIADLALKYHVAPTPSELASGSGTISLASGRLGMSLDGTWQVYFYQREHNAKWPVSIGVMPKFKTYQDIAFGPPYVASVKTQHPKEAVELLHCYEDSYILNQQALGSPPQRSLLTTNFARWGINTDHPKNYRSVVVDTILNHTTSLPSLHMYKFNSSWNNLIQPAIDSVMTGKKTATEALSGAIKTQVDAVLAQP